MQKFVAQFPAIVLTGPRQVGKTSTLLHVFPEYDYVSLDLPYNAAQAEENPERFLADHAENHLIIDEVQYAPSLFRYLKAHIDQDRRSGRFLLTGSQHLQLMDTISESLAGRCGVLNMLGLSVSEIFEAGFSLDEETLIWKGGMPELYARDELTPEYWFTSYVATYLERDVRNILHIGNLRDFDRFLRACALRIGQLLSLSDLAKDVGISPNTVKSWLSVLQTSGQIFLLEPYYQSLGKRLTKSPKLYFTDAGIAAFLLGFDAPNRLSQSPLFGQFWENFVVLEYLKHTASQGRQPRMWFWRTRTGEEVDLIIEHSGQVTAIECKSTERPGEKDIRILKSFARHMQRDVQSLVVCRTPKSYPLADNVQAVPIKDFLEAIKKTNQ
ncbi:MAG: ATP-binding protein [Desulfovermiculus sp.]